MPAGVCEERKEREGPRSGVTVDHFAGSRVFLFSSGPRHRALVEHTDEIHTNDARYIHRVVDFYIRWLGKRSTRQQDYIF